MDIRSTEAAVKYLVFGVLASGAMLFGFSLLYGFTGSVRLPDMKGLSLREAARTVFELGLTPALEGTGTLSRQDPPPAVGRTLIPDPFFDIALMMMSL